MKKTALVLFIVILSAASAYASDYQGNEKEDSVFQRLGDFITGKYDVGEGKTLKEKGIFQVLADETQKIKPESSEGSMWTTK